jgi:hypothetical protein
MFFATPHRGSQQADTGEILARTANAATRITTLGIAKAPFRVDQIKELQKKSLQLHEIHETFRRRSSQLDVRSFLETQETVFIGRRAGIVRILPFLYLCPPTKTQLTSAGQVVDQQSAIVGLDKEITIPTVHSHITICRFGRNDKFWPTVRKNLKEMARSSLQTRAACGSQGTS